MKTGDLFNPYKVFAGVFIPTAIVRYSDLSPGSKICYGRLAQYAGENGKAYPKHESLAAEIGVSSRQARRYIEELAAANFIKVVHTRTSNHYYFLWHEILEDSLKVNVTTWTDMSTPPGQICPPHLDGYVQADKADKTLQDKGLSGENDPLRESLKQSLKESGALSNLTTEKQNQVEEIIKHYTDLFTKANGIGPVITKTNRQTVAKLLAKHGADLLLAAVELHVNEPDSWTREKGCQLAILEHNLPGYIEKINQRKAEEEAEKQRREYQRQQKEEDRQREERIEKERAAWEALPEEERARQRAEIKKQAREAIEKATTG